MIKKTLTIVLCLLMVHCAFGQKEQFKRLDLKDGLSHPEVWTIFKDSRGFVWFGTASGLNRFDGYAIKTFFNDPRDTTSMPGNGIYRIFETPDGTLAIITSEGLTLYDPQQEKFERHLQRFFDKYGASKRLINIVRGTDGSYWFVEPDKLIRYHPNEQGSTIVQNNSSDSSSVVNDEITDFCIDQKSNHWLMHSNGIAEKIEVRNKKWQVAERVFALYNREKSIHTSYQIMADGDGDLWFCGPSTIQGVFFYSVKENTLKQLTVSTTPLKLNTNVVSGLLEIQDGVIWIGTDHGGINVVDKKKMTVRYILHRDGDQTGLMENSVIRMYRDDQGIVWIGGYKRGVSYYHPNIYQFDVYKHYSIDPRSLPFEDINRFEEDINGNLWIGTNGGGLLYLDRKSGKFKQYLNEPGNDNSLCGNVIVSLRKDTEGNLWIGTYGNGLNKFDGKKFTRFNHVVGDSTSLPSQNIWEIFEDSKKRLWIGTLGEGVALFDRKTGKFHKVKAWGPNAMQSNTIAAITEDPDSNIWFGTIAGIDVLSADGKTFTHYGSSSEPNSLSNASILDITKDSKGRIWVGTQDGLNLFDKSIRGFRTFKANRTSNAVLAVEEDNAGNIWMSSLNGLLKMIMINGSLDSVSFKRYTEMDGLQGRQFNLNAGFKTRNGELIFGGPTGFNTSNGNDDRKDFVIDKIVFTELELYEKHVNIGEKINDVVVLNKSISEATEIVLPPNKNFFSLKFSDLNYFNPERDQYLYSLDGLNSEWIPVDARNHEIVFNSLNPGKYKLRIKAANSEGIWSNHEATLLIIIQPPFWKTKTAFVLYALLLIFIMIAARKLIQQREKLKFSLEQERHELQRVHELDMMKVKFFTNVSHEFRTPLTLILTPIERLLKKATNADQMIQFQLIERNGKRLMKLVNQLLDFKKLEVHDIKFNPSKGDIISFAKDTTLSFSDLSDKKGIKLQFNSSIEHLETLFDQDKLEKILFNLLSNAFKFTLENGVVSVNLEVIHEDDNEFLKIEVNDTGIGIPRDKLDKIFEPFFQTDLPKSIVNVGSGIGLAITKEFVIIHKGNIKVNSEVGKGSSFSVFLPLKIPFATNENDLEVQLIDDQNSVVQNQNADESPIDRESGKLRKKSLLLIDDNDDFRFYLKDNLKFLYTIHEASDGADGWNKILAIQPDLIVSDIMMPEVNGIELCTKIKTDERVSHIPVILLTARSSEEQRVEGFKTGADDYITKPFNFEVLEARINNLLRRREKSQKTFRKTLDVKSSDLQITPLDVTFIDNAVKCVEKNVSSPDFSVEDLGMELGISRAYVFKKILALTGKTPLEFIRTIRLQHAAQLLEKSQLSVREIAYKVGFNNPKYFTKYFKEQFHVLPSDYAASKNKDE